MRTIHSYLSILKVYQRLTLCFRNRALSIRSGKNKESSSGGARHGFSLTSFRGSVQPELSRKLYKLIKTENNLISCYETAGKERTSIATQLSDWGEQTGDDAISDISDKVGVLLAELGEQEDLYAHNLDDSRAVLKAIRNTEKSVQPSRDNKAKIQDEIAKLKHKEPESAKLVTLEQELVRAEAENLVAEAQLTNIVGNPLSLDVILTDFGCRLDRRSRRPMLPSLLPLSSAQRSRSFSPVTDAVFYNSLTILPSFLATYASHSRVPTRPAKS